jgi:hypothetical protein
MSFSQVSKLSESTSCDKVKYRQHSRVATRKAIASTYQLSIEALDLGALLIGSPKTVEVGSHGGLS